MAKRKKLLWVLFAIGYVITYALYITNSYTLGQYTVQYLFWAGLAMVITNAILDKMKI